MSINHMKTKNIVWISHPHLSLSKENNKCHHIITNRTHYVSLVLETIKSQVEYEN